LETNVAMDILYEDQKEKIYQKEQIYPKEQI
jgi:hypothetical protein